MFEEFYEMYEPEEQEVVALINRCIGGGYNWKGNFWEMTVVTLGVVFCGRRMRKLYCSVPIRYWQYPKAPLNLKVILHLYIS